MFSTEVRVYPTLVKLDFLGTLSYLISHDNIVISTDVIKLLYGLVSVCHVVMISPTTTRLWRTPRENPFP